MSKEAYYTILGVKADASREVLTVFNAPTESSTQWKELFYELKQRGVKQVNLVVCDGLSGIENAIKEVFPQSEVQLCTVHLKRGILSKVKSCDKAVIAQSLKEVFSTENKYNTPLSGHEKFVSFIEQWKVKYPSLKSYLIPRTHLYFTYLKYDIKIQSMIYTTNWIERLNRNYRRVTKMRGALPNAESALFLLGATAMDRDEYTYPIHAFLNTDLFQQKT